MHNVATKERTMAGAEPGTEITDEQIRERAYEISQRPDAGTDEENWVRAEQELQGGNGAPKPRSRAPKSSTEAT